MGCPPRAIIEHEGRLDLICCLVDKGPLTVPGMSAETGKAPLAVAFLLEQLELYRVVWQTGDRVGREPLYEERLRDHPAWMRRLVEKHCGAAKQTNSA